MTVPNGNEKTGFFYYDGANVTAFSPIVPLFILEDPRAYGIDERFLVSKFNVAGLETLIEAFKSRSLVLRDQFPRLRQSYPYFIYNPSEDSISGVNLLSHAIAPTIQREIETFDAHHLVHGTESMIGIGQYGYVPRLTRTKITDIADAEFNKLGKLDCGVVTGNQHFAALRVPGMLDNYDLLVIPHRHVPRLENLYDEQIKSLGQIIHESAVKVADKARNQRGYEDLVYGTIHSAPYYSPNLRMLGKYTRGEYLHSQDVLGMIFTLHVHIGARIPPQIGYPVPVQFSGWKVVAERNTSK